MKRPHFIFTIFSMLAMAACMQRMDKDTEELEKYLSEHFALHVDGEQVYCLIPDNQCRSCFIYDGHKLLSDIDQRLTIVSGFPTSNFKHFSKVYYDHDDAMLSLKLLNYGNKIIICNNHRISSIIPLTDFYRQMDSIGKVVPIH